MFKNSMPANTRGMFEILSRISLPMENDVWLCGGTGLSLLWNHRQSEDMDFLSTKKLKPGEINRWIAALQKMGYSVVDAMPLFERQLAEDDLYDLDDYQRDFVIDKKVKVTFFYDEDAAKILNDAELYGKQGSIRVPDEDTLFRLKIKALLDRNKSRDSFDIATGVAMGRYSIDDIVSLIKLIQPHARVDLMLIKLMTKSYHINDEGFSSVLNGNSPFNTIDELSEFMSKEINEWSLKESVDFGF